MERIKNDLGRWVLPRDVVRLLAEDALKELKAKGVLHAKGRTLYLVREEEAEAAERRAA